MLIAKKLIISKFLFNETKGLFTNNNCYALPNIFQLYGGVKIEVKVHFSGDRFEQHCF